MPVEPGAIVFPSFDADGVRFSCWSFEANPYQLEVEVAIAAVAIAAFVVEMPVFHWICLPLKFGVAGALETVTVKPYDAYPVRRPSQTPKLHSTIIWFSELRFFVRLAATAQMLVRTPMRCRSALLV